MLELNRCNMSQPLTNDDFEEDFTHDICDEFDCNSDYCIEKTGVDCQFQFWTDACIFRSAHLVLNCPKEE